MYVYVVSLVLEKYFFLKNNVYVLLGDTIYIYIYVCVCVCVCV